MKCANLDKNVINRTGHCICRPKIVEKKIFVKIFINGQVPFSLIVNLPIICIFLIKTPPYYRQLPLAFILQFCLKLCNLCPVTVTELTVFSSIIYNCRLPKVLSSFYSRFGRTLERTFTTCSAPNIPVDFLTAGCDLGCVIKLRCDLDSVILFLLF